MEEEREALYHSREAIKEAIEELLATPHPVQHKICELEESLTKITKRLRAIDGGEFIEKKALPSPKAEDPFKKLRQYFDILLQLAQSKDRLRDLFFGRPRKARMAQFFYSSGQEAKKLLKLPLTNEMETLLHEWIFEVEKIKNPDLYHYEKIEVYANRLRAIYPRIMPAPGVGGG